MKKRDKINLKKSGDNNKTLYIIIAVIVILVLAFLIYNYFFDDRDVRLSGDDAGSVDTTTTTQPQKECGSDYVDETHKEKYDCVLFDDSLSLDELGCIEKVDDRTCKGEYEKCCKVKVIETDPCVNRDVDFYYCSCETFLNGEFRCTVDAVCSGKGYQCEVDEGCFGYGATYIYTRNYVLPGVISNPVETYEHMVCGIPSCTSGNDTECKKYGEEYICLFGNCVDITLG